MNDNLSDEDIENSSICRVCRCESSENNVLQHPCLCSGSIKHVHKDCLTQWLEYSGRDVCELCGHKFIFQTIYRDDMPFRLPAMVLMSGLKDIFRYGLATIVWVVLLPVILGKLVQTLVFSSAIEPVGWGNMTTSLIDRYTSLDHLGDEFVCGLLLLGLNFVLAGGIAHLYSAILQQQPRQLEVPLIVPEEQEDDANIVEEEEEDPNLEENPQLPAMAAPDDAAEQQDVQIQPPAIHGADFLALLDFLHLFSRNNQPGRIAQDGSFIYLLFAGEFLLVSLAMFLSVIGFYNIGKSTLTIVRLESYISTAFDELIFITVGIFVSAIIFAHTNMFCSNKCWQRGTFWTGMGFLMLKFILYIIGKIVVFPIFCGLTMSICCMDLFGSDVHGLLTEFIIYPATTVVTHLLQGHIFNLCICQFIIELRRLLRTGIIWFFIDFEDPDLNPVKNIVIGSVRAHIWGFMYSSVYFFVAILIVMWLPLRIFQMILPSILPLTYDNSIWTVLAERLLVPFLIFFWLYPGFLTHQWCKMWGHVLDLRSYLFADEPSKPGDLIAKEDGTTILSEESGALRTVRTKADTSSYLFTYYRRPYRFFALRVFLLCAASASSLSILCGTNYAISLLLGRAVFAWLLPEDQNHVSCLAAGLIVFEMFGKLALKVLLSIVLRNSRIRSAAMAQFGDHLFYFFAISITVLLVFILPATVGHIINITFFNYWNSTAKPFESSVLFTFEKWLLGLEVAIALTPMAAVFCYLKLLYSGRNPKLMDLRDLLGNILKSLAITIFTMMVALCSSYALNVLIGWALPAEYGNVHRIMRPYIPCVACAMALLDDFRLICKKFCQRLRDEKYLLGRELVNYNM